MGCICSSAKKGKSSTKYNKVNQAKSKQGITKKPGTRTDNQGSINDPIANQGSSNDPIANQHAKQGLAKTNEQGQDSHNNSNARSRIVISKIPKNNFSTNSQSEQDEEGKLSSEASPLKEPSVKNIVVVEAEFGSSSQRSSYVSDFDASGNARHFDDPIISMQHSGALYLHGDDSQYQGSGVGGEQPLFSQMVKQKTEEREKLKSDEIGEKGKAKGLGTSSLVGLEGISPIVGSKLTISSSKNFGRIQLEPAGVRVEHSSIIMDKGHAIDVVDNLGIPFTEKGSRKASGCNLYNSSEQLEGRVKSGGRANGGVQKENSREPSEARLVVGGQIFATDASIIHQNETINEAHQTRLVDESHLQLLDDLEKKNSMNQRGDGRGSLQVKTTKSGDLGENSQLQIKTPVDGIEGGLTINHEDGGGVDESIRRDLRMITDIDSEDPEEEKEGMIEQNGQHQLQRGPANSEDDSEDLNSQRDKDKPKVITVMTRSHPFGKVIVLKKSRFYHNRHIPVKALRINSRSNAEKNNSSSNKNLNENITPIQRNPNRVKSKILVPNKFNPKQPHLITKISKKEDKAGSEVNQRSVDAHRMSQFSSSTSSISSLDVTDTMNKDRIRQIFDESGNFRIRESNEKSKNDVIGGSEQGRGLQRMRSDYGPDLKHKEAGKSKKCISHKKILVPMSGKSQTGQRRSSHRASTDGRNFKFHEFGKINFKTQKNSKSRQNQQLEPIQGLPEEYSSEMDMRGGSGVRGGNLGSKKIKKIKIEKKNSKNVNNGQKFSNQNKLVTSRQQAGNGRGDQVGSQQRMIEPLDLVNRLASKPDGISSIHQRRGGPEDLGGTLNESDSILFKNLLNSKNLGRSGFEERSSLKQ